MTPISLPSEHVTYTIRHKLVASVGQWHSFTLAVTEAFWHLPSTLRPHYHATAMPMAAASMMFPHPEKIIFCGEDSGDHFTKDVSFSRDPVWADKNWSAGTQVIETEGQPIDLFTRIVLILLHNHCKGCFEITSSAGGVSWSLPVRWAIRHQLIDDSAAPQPFCTHNFITGAADELLIRSITGAERSFTTADWELLSEFEFALEELKTGKR